MNVSSLRKRVVVNEEKCLKRIKYNTSLFNKRYFNVKNLNIEKIYIIFSKNVASNASVMNF